MMPFLGGFIDGAGVESGELSREPTSIPKFFPNSSSFHRPVAVTQVSPQVGRDDPEGWTPLADPSRGRCLPDQKPLDKA